MARPIFGLSMDVVAGIVLAFGAALGLLFENIGVLAPYYDALLGTNATVAIGALKISKPLLLWINDGLMAIFFFLVALEIKREVVRGALSTWSRASLPVYGAIGGIVVPALVFVGIVGIDSMEARGWAIPAATDIAFALGVLGLFGKKVPSELKTFLLALAVVDDLAAISIIAIFFTAELSLMALSLAAIAIIGLVTLNLSGVKKGAPYILLGIILWVAVLKSGVHATLAGVALGFAIPLEADKNGRSLATEYEHGLHPWSVFLIMPVFAFANSGIPLRDVTLEALMQPLPLAIAGGLFIGKQIGVFGVVVLVVKLGLSQKPTSISWLKLYGVSCLAGIGFTMSLFIGGLAFIEPEQQTLVRAGVLLGSLMSALMATVVFLLAKELPKPVPISEPQFKNT